MKLFIITPYEAMFGAIKNAINHFTDIEIEYGMGDLEQGVELALEAEGNDFDAIISRGGTAQMIQERVNIPVIDMGLSGYDLLKTIIMANHQKEKTALIGFSNITSGAYAILDLLELSTEIYTIESEDEVYSLLIELKEEGFRYIIGDVITSKKATDLNLHSILLQSGEETIKTAIKQAYFTLSHLSKEDYLNGSIAKGFRTLNENYLLIKDNKIIESSLNAFQNKPLNKEQIYSVLNEYDSKKQINTFYFNELKLTIDVLSYNYMNERYYLLLLKPLSLQLNTISGVNEYVLNPSYKLVARSEAMKKIIKQLPILMKQNKIVCFIGNDSVTENTLIKFMYQNINNQGRIIELDFDIVELEDLITLDWTSIRLIKLKNIKSKQLQVLLGFIKKYDIKLVITGIRNKISDSLLNSQKVIPITIPSFKERTEDSFEIVSHLIGYYHNNLGTKAIKIIEKTHRNVIEDYLFESLDEYVALMKGAIFRESSYTISFKTIKDVIAIFSNESKTRFEDTSKTLEEVEMEYIEKIVEEENFNQTKAAERLGISRATLWRKLKHE